MPLRQAASNNQDGFVRALRGGFNHVDKYADFAER